MRDAALWARLEAADLGPAETFDPAFRDSSIASHGDVARGAVLAAGSLSKSGQSGSWFKGLLPVGKPLPPQVKAAIMLELRRFLYLLAVSGEKLAPSTYVASALQSQFVACDKVLESLGLGRLTLDPPRARWRNMAAMSRTIALRAEEFGPDDPEHVWPQALSLKLQMLGWAALGAGMALIILGRLGDTGTTLWGVPLLALGGFLWATEGPWPLDLPFRQGFMASLAA